MAEVFANSEDPDQMPHSAASDRGLHCLPITLLGVSQIQWDMSHWNTEKQAEYKYSQTDGLNPFGTMKICLRQR